MGEKTHKQNPPQNPGTIPRNVCLRVFFLRGFCPINTESKPSFLGLVSHYSAIGVAPYGAVGFRGKFSAMPPLLGLSLVCDRPLLRKEVGV